MTRRKTIDAEVSLEALQLDVPVHEVDEDVETPKASFEEPFAEPASVALADDPVDQPGEPEAPAHKDIGLWEALSWKGRPIWRHRRSKVTLHRRDLVWKHRNLK
jgi:hypothetical protein